jgi:hypothetical protein
VQLPTTHLAYVLHEQDGDDLYDMLWTSPGYHEFNEERTRMKVERRRFKAEEAEREAERKAEEAEHSKKMEMHSKKMEMHSKKIAEHKVSFLKQLSEKIELGKREHQKQQDLAERVEIKTKMQSQIDVMEAQLKVELALLTEQSATAQHQYKTKLMAAEQHLTAVKAQHTAALQQIEKNINQELSAAIQDGGREVQTLQLFTARVAEFEEKYKKRTSQADADHAIQRKELEKDADIAASKTKLAETEAKIRTAKKALEVKHSAQVAATKQAGELQLKALQSKQTDLQAKALKEEADAHALIWFNNVKRKALADAQAKRNVKARVAK